MAKIDKKGCGKWDIYAVCDGIGKKS